MTEEECKGIITLQKELIDKILQYQINNGSKSIQWNVTVNFIEQPIVARIINDR